MTTNRPPQSGVAPGRSERSRIRRSLVKALTSIALLPASPCGLAGAGSVDPGREGRALASVFPVCRLGSLARIGLACLSQHGAARTGMWLEQSATGLRAVLGSGDPRAELWKRARSDFERGLVVEVGGWHLSRIEVALGVVAAMQQRSPP